MRGHRLLPALACTVLLLPTAPSRAADRAEHPVPPRLEREVPNNPYIPVPRDLAQKSPAYRYSAGSFFAVQVNVDSDGQNILGDAANEPSIAVDPTDPDHMVIGWRQFDTIASDFRQAGNAYTTDGGQTWTFPGVIEPGVFRSDPVLDSDSDGGIHYNSLTLIGSSDFECKVFGSSDGGMTWDSGVPAHGGDKQWMAIDKSGAVGDGHTYAFWTSFYSSCYPENFTRSTNGSFYENCISIPLDPYWGTITVGPTGTLYVAGTTGNNFGVARSSNAKLSLGQAMSWDQSTTVSLGGSIDSGLGPNPGGLAGQTWIAADPTSGGPGGDRVYLLCSVNPPGSDPLDVRFSRSTDSGATWSSSIRVNDDAGTSAYQWFGTMSVSPSGRIDAVWLDTRDDPGGYDSSLYYSYSTDQGVTWSANERLSDAFDPHLGWPQQDKMGDYFHMVSDNAGFRLAWAATFNGEEDVYYGRELLNPVVAVGEDLAPVQVALQSSPNPFDVGTTIRYQVPRDAFVTLKVYDALGRRVATLVSDEQHAGAYRTRLDGRGLASGVYFYRLTAGDFTATRKVLRVK
jgi:Secretion system C-terminal sorting domain